MLRLRFVFSFLLLFGLILAFAPSGSASAQLADPIPAPVPATGEIVSLETVATGLTAPNWGTSAPGVLGRLFVTDQDGILWSIELATGNKSVFLDVSGQITALGIFGPGSFDERGLLGVAFHPGYASNGLLYTYTSEPVTGTADFSTMPVATVANHHAVITEWNVPDPTNPASVVNAASERELMRIDEPQFNHNAGALNFGPDGRLYISLGDGGGADDVDGQAFIGGPIIGHGTGMSATALLGDTQLERVTSIEIELEVLRASREFLPANRPVFEDPRSEIVVGDAKTHFATVDEPYDLIFSEPSNPWVSGVASLFTVEFYQHLKRYMSPDGVLGQWIHMYESDDGLLLSVLAAIHEAFPSYSLFTTNDVDLLIIASPTQLPAPDWNRVARAVERTGLLCGAPPLRPFDLGALHLADRPVFAPLLDGWQFPNSDFYPVLDLGADRARFLRGSASGFVMLRYDGINIPAVVSDQRIGPLPDRRIGVHGVHRLQLLQMAAAIREGVTSDDSTVSSQQLAEALARAGRWQALVGNDGEGRDWPFWLGEFRDVERDRNEGMDGVVDEEFYRSVYAFLDRHDPPPLLRTAVDLHYGLAAWNFELVSRSADVLAASDDRATWINPDLLIEGGVTAKLKLGDGAGARALYLALVSEYRRAPDHLRRRLIESYLRSEE